MNISIIKKLRRNICKAVGHNYETLGFYSVCSRCKKKGVDFIDTLEGCTGIIPSNNNISYPIIGDIRYDTEAQRVVVYDGNNWIQC